MSFHHRQSDWRTAADGRVPCPLKRCDVDIETCAGCSHLIAMDTDAVPRWIRCETPRFYRLGELPLPIALLRQ